MFGIAPMINFLVWFWGVMLAGGLVNLTGMFMYFLEMDSAYSDYGYVGSDAVLIAKSAKSIAV